MKKLFLGLTVVLGLVSRFYLIDKAPPHLSNDEISIAYDAYSVAYSGRDEHGNAYPLSFESHGTYKTPVYSYTLIPLIKIFGNSELVARIPSIIAGLITVVMAGLIALEMTKNKSIAIYAALILLICPWHIVTSRMVLEANLALALLSVGMWLVLKKQFWRSLVPLALSVYAYHTEWILVPLLAVLIKMFYLKGKKGWIWLVTLALMCLPLLGDYVSNAGGGARANSEVLWKEAGFVINLQNIIVRFCKNYLDYFNPSYLFFNGLGLLPSENPFQPGLFLWPMLAPLAIGLIKIKKTIKKKHLKFFLFWLFISPLTASLTHGGQNMVRNLNTVLPLIIVISIGVVNFKWWWLMTLAVFGQFLIIYFWLYPIEVAKSFQGYREVARYLATVEEEAESIYIDYRYGNYRWGKGVEYIGVPHLYFGFFNNWDPLIIQKRERLVAGTRFDKYLIGQIDWNQDIIRENRYFVVSVGNPPEEIVKPLLDEIATFNDAAGQKAFEVWKGK